MIRRVGVDTLAIERMAVAVRRSGESFLRRSFTPSELAYCGGLAERLAGRWAAKEAIIKCFDGTPICFPRRHIEVLPTPSGAPRVNLVGNSVPANVQVSISHESGIAVAVAHLEMAAGAEQPVGVPGALALPARPAAGHKGTFGTVVVLAGSIGLTGAAYLSATAAARAGAGTVRLLAAESIYPILASKCTEVMATPVPEAAPGAVGRISLEAVVRELAAGRVGLLGPGLGRDPATWHLIGDVVAKAANPLVLDADALNALAGNRGLLGNLGPNRILTPHPGEMSRLTGRPSEELQRDRATAAATAARDWGAVVVLKGARTVVAAPDGRLSQDPHQVPALASGGTGDVLAGIIAGLLAQGSDPFTAAVTGVFVHAEAGRHIAARLGDSGLLASDLLGEIPLVMKRLRSGDES